MPSQSSCLTIYKNILDIHLQFMSLGSERPVYRNTLRKAADSSDAGLLLKSVLNRLLLGGRVIPIVVAVSSHGPTECCRLSYSPLIQSVLKHISPQLIVTHQHAPDHNGATHSATGRQNMREQRSISHKHKHST